MRKKFIFLYLINGFFQVFGVTSLRVPFLHFTNVISSDKNFQAVGSGEALYNCLQINGGILIQCSMGVEIHRDVFLGPGVKIISANKIFHKNVRTGYTMSGSKIKIGKGVQIGANAVVLSGVSIGRDSTIGAGAVVNCNVPPESVVVGNPARVISRRKR